MPRQHIPTYTRGNIQIGHVTIMAKKRPPDPPCWKCGQPGPLLCDGTGTGPGATCDRPLCPRCAVSIRVLDKEFCEEHATGVHAVSARCLLAGGVGLVPCGGVFVESDSLCVRHEVFFDEWAGHHGGMAIYQDKRLPREERRQRFRTWLEQADAALVASICARRHLPTS